MTTLAWLALAFFSGAASAGQMPATYLDTIPRFWANVYPEGGETLYCGVPFEPHDRRTNIEHVFPMSWVANHLRCGDRDRCRQTGKKFNQIESDMHNLFPALRSVNRRRGSLPFGMVAGERWIEAGCDLEIDDRSRRVEPRPAVRGDIARAMLYMSDRYGLELFRRQRDLLERWHREDPPSADERRRNDVIERLQGGRNPYID